MANEDGVIWAGKQWRVTPEALEEIDEECPERAYRIDVDLLPTDHTDANAGWPSHMAEKCWVDLDEFVKAYLIACVAHRVILPNVGAIIDAGFRLRRTKP